MGESGLLGLEFFLYLLNINGLQNRLRILELQRLTTYSRLGAISAKLSFKSCNCHGYCFKDGKNNP